MRFSSNDVTTLSLLSLLLPSIVAAISIDCGNIRVEQKSFNIEQLEGPHSLYKVLEHPNNIKNTTFTFDICRPLKKTKGVPKDEDCPNGSRGKLNLHAIVIAEHLLHCTLLFMTNTTIREVCAIERLTNKVENITTITDTIPIAGEFAQSIGGPLDPVWARLKGSESSADRAKEGIRLTMNGGKYDGKNQKAIVEFLCNAKSEERKRDITAAAEEDDQDGEQADDEHGGKLKLLSWEVEEDTKVLRLEWNTKYACEDAEEGNGSSSGHWGFFTWFILM